MMRTTTLLAFLLLFTGGCQSEEKLYLVISDQENDQIFVEEQITEGQQITLSWIHSVEKTPWSEIYDVTEKGQLVLTETEFESFGAGVDFSGGTMTVEDGKVVVKDIDQPVESITWIHSQNAEHTVRIGETIKAGPEYLPHHHAIELVIEER
ncbi:DUF1850 domain-containing protein [Alteribacter salitolerans]|uniref:DUF1850 domain-containing protein n=1 Tax=Alteribacter salitolerans TaxID=2912333 RepID=UPI001F292938|nr:DUF1850 domain-containing protein [Alteribacter salitolerans]